MVTNLDISAVQGDTIKIAAYVTGAGGTAYNLSGVTLSAQLRRGYYPSSIVASYQTYVPAGTLITGFPAGFTGGISAAATGGTIYISFGSTYVSQCSSEATAKYDVQMFNNSTKDTTTILRGSIKILPEVTR